MERYNTAYRAGSATQTAEYDEGLRAYMLKVYNYMASGVLLTGIISMMVSQSETLMLAIFGGPQAYIIMFAPLIFSFAISFGAHKYSSGTLQIMFWAFASIMGLSLSIIFLAYTGESIARVFFITAASFGALSLYGYTTKKSLSGWASFLYMGMFGIIIAGIVNVFLGSETLRFVYSAIGVIVFSGITAYATQAIKDEYFLMSTGEHVKKGAILGAFTLYITFINLFMMLLNLLGNRE